MLLAIAINAQSLKLRTGFFQTDVATVILGGERGRCGVGRRRVGPPHPPNDVSLLLLDVGVWILRGGGGGGGGGYPLFWASTRARRPSTQAIPGARPARRACRGKAGQSPASTRSNTSGGPVSSRSLLSGWIYVRSRSPSKQSARRTDRNCTCEFDMAAQVSPEKIEKMHWAKYHDRHMIPVELDDNLSTAMM